MWLPHEEKHIHSASCLRHRLRTQLCALNRPQNIFFNISRSMLSAWFPFSLSQFSFVWSTHLRSFSFRFRQNWSMCWLLVIQVFCSFIDLFPRALLFSYFQRTNGKWTMVFDIEFVRIRLGFVVFVKCLAGLGHFKKNINKLLKSAKEKTLSLLRLWVSLNIECDGECVSR